jgi:hypothetical protein
MQRIVLKYSSLAANLAFFTLGCTETSNAQAAMKASTANSSVTMQEPPEEDEPQENLDYLVDTWSSPVTKEEVKQITAISDFWSDESYLSPYHFQRFQLVPFSYV